MLNVAWCLTVQPLAGLVMCVSHFHRTCGEKSLSARYQSVWGLQGLWAHIPGQLRCEEPVGGWAHPMHGRNWHVSVEDMLPMRVYKASKVRMPIRRTI